jgi:hypothetical protein
MRRLLAWLRQGTQNDTRDRAAIQRALDCFGASHREQVSGAFVVRREKHEVIVRVMYWTGSIPPHRAWYAVPDDGADLRELSLAEAGDGGAWR